MLNFLFGALAASCLFVFFPKLAETPSKWLRAGWAWIKGFGKDSP